MTLCTEIQPWHGAPALFLNGEPDPGLMHWHTKPLEAAGDIARLAAIGVRLFTFPMGLAWANEDGCPDFAPLDQYLASILAGHDDVLLMPRIGLDPPGWWIERHPEEMMLSQCIDDGNMVRSYRASISSAAWRQDAMTALTLLISHLEQHWGDRVVGYHLAVGDCGEFSYDWGFPDKVLSDYSAPHLRAFRNWLSERYAGDSESFRAAWCDPELDFATAAIPSTQRRIGLPGDLSLLDPDCFRDVIDYQTFHSEAMAGAVLFACGGAKTALRALGREKICGAFYGYHHWGPGAQVFFFNSGHHAQQQVLEAPDVDFLCAPNHYNNRHSGGSYAAQLLPASLRLHGKFFYAEDDTGTHLAHKDWWGFTCVDAEMSARLLRRNFLGVLQDGGTPWWMDWAGTGWYRDDTILRELQRLGEFAHAQMHGDRASCSQVAVILSDDSVAYMRADSTLKDSLIDRQLEELTALGAPVDLYRSGDIEKLVQQAKVKEYRLVIFVGALALSSKVRDIIQHSLACEGRTLLWVYAQGLATNEHWDIEAASALTGMQLRLQRNMRPCLVETFLTGTRVVYGSLNPIGPILVGVDPEAEIAGFLQDSTSGAVPELGYEPGLLIKQFPDWRSIWSAAPALPAEILRLFARQAGVHIYAERGDQVYVGHGWCGLHARVDGPLRIALPQKMTVIDAFTGTVIAEDVDEFTITTTKGETYLWKCA